MTISHCPCQLSQTVPANNQGPLAGLDSIRDHFTNFVHEQVASGRYASASDVLRAGLRLLKREEEELAWLRERIAESDADIEAGRVHEVIDAYWEMLDKAVDERVKRNQGEHRVAS